MRMALNKMVLVVVCTMASTLVQAQEQKIEASKSAFHVGKTVMACGTLAEIKHFPKKHYFNFDKKYPNHSLGLLVWDSNYKWFEQRFGDMNQLLGRRLCARGKIEQYKNHLQMIVENPQFLRVME